MLEGGAQLIPPEQQKFKSGFISKNPAGILAAIQNKNPMAESQLRTQGKTIPKDVSLQ
jgi:hypothetical protein